MCGVAGILEFDKEKEPLLEELSQMAQVLRHRGPDEEGFYRSGPVGLAHRRLSIIDLVSGQQPMQSLDGRACVVFNGEIYNFPELRKELEEKGYTFRTRSDTEVLLTLYLHYGLEAFSKMNGMFACAFWDQGSHQLVLARDRFGKKPLFYYNGARRFLFGSEIKSLLALRDVERKINWAALHEYLTHSYIVGDESVIAGIQRLPPAHVLVVRDGELKSWPYWEFKFEPDVKPPSEADAAAQLEELLRQAVRRRLLSDVPLGAFLSGGLDSSTVVALMAQSSTRPVRTFTIGFEEADYSELEDARIVAHHLGTEHHETIVRPSAIEILPHLVWHLDEPFGDSSAVPTYFVCKATREFVTVALSGDGGDEVFAGYTRYQTLGRYQRFQRIPVWIRRRFVKPLTGLLPFTWPGWNYLYAVGDLRDGALPSGLGIYPYIQSKVYSADLISQIGEYDAFAQTEELGCQVAHLDPITRYQYLDTRQYLPDDILTKVDRMSMANSLEVRAPLLDYQVVEFMATLPLSYKIRDGVSKRILRQVCGRMLPASVLKKRKQGFALPKGQWFQKELRGAAEEILLDRKTLSRGYFRQDTLEQILRHQARGVRDYSTWIWCLMVLEIWHRLFFDGGPVGLSGQAVTNQKTASPFPGSYRA